MFPSHGLRHYMVRCASLSQVVCRQQSGHPLPAALPALHRFQRNEKLREIYKPFDKLVKGSKEYEELACSGEVWENYIIISH